MVKLSNFSNFQNSYQDPLFYRPCMVGVCMMLSQQLSGINAIMFYSTKIFLAAGLDEPKKGTVFVGIINVIFSGVCVVLIERFGRKVSFPQSVPNPRTIRVPSPGLSPVRLVSGVVIFSGT